MKCVFFARLSIRRAAACLCALLFVFCLAPANARAAGRADELIALVNTAREKEGLAALNADETLARAAQIKCRDMIIEGYFTHESPNYGDMKSLLSSLGLSVSCAENIARYGSLEKAHAALLSSAAHRKNILSRGFNRIGAAVMNGKDSAVYVVEVFARF